MIVDSSALIAILNDESDAVAYARTMHASTALSVAAPTVLETAIAAGPERGRGVDELLAGMQASITPFGPEHAAAAREAHTRYGKGSGHPASLNLGDCMAYALAKVSGEPLLFKGDDFTHTDVEPAYRP